MAILRLIEFDPHKNSSSYIPKTIEAELNSLKNKQGLYSLYDEVDKQLSEHDFEKAELLFSNIELEYLTKKTRQRFKSKLREIEFELNCRISVLNFDKFYHQGNKYRKRQRIPEDDRIVDVIYEENN